MYTRQKCHIDRIGEQRRNWSKSLRFNGNIVETNTQYCFNNLSNSFNNIAVESRRFALITVLLVDSVDTTAFCCPSLFLDCLKPA